MNLVTLRKFALHRQCLDGTIDFGAHQKGTLAVIEHLGYVQIDTISVVERAHHHVLWSRIADYQPDFLNHLIKEKKIFEYWYHAAAYLPMKDYRFALPRMHAISSGEHPYFSNIDKKIMKKILDQVKLDGPIRVRDITKADQKKSSSGTWWNWGPGKRALDKLFMQGELMVCERNGMEKIYDLPERCLPSKLNLQQPNLEEYARYLFENCLRAHGVFSLKQIMHLRKGADLKKELKEIIGDHVADKRLLVSKDLAGTEFYVDAAVLDFKLQPTNREIKILSPFDNAVIHRDRLKVLFDFDFKIECYVPAGKRQFGYFCLPILYENQFVGRIDCKAHRKNQQLEVIQLFLERDVANQSVFTKKLNVTLQQFAKFNRCEQVLM